MSNQPSSSNFLTDFLYDLLWALGWTSIFGLGSWLTTRWLFDDLYYLSALLPLVMMLFLIAGWFSYLRYDGMTSGVTAKSKHHESECPKDTLNPQGPLVGETTGRATRILFLTGILLGLLATLLYHVFDIGARVSFDILPILVHSLTQSGLV